MMVPAPVHMTGRALLALSWLVSETSGQATTTQLSTSKPGYDTYQVSMQFTGVGRSASQGGQFRDACKDLPVSINVVIFLSTVVLMRLLVLAVLVSVRVSARVSVRVFVHSRGRHLRLDDHIKDTIRPPSAT